MSSSNSYLPQHFFSQSADIAFESHSGEESRTRATKQGDQTTHCVALFSCLTDKELRFLSERAISRKYHKNTLIISECDDTTSLYIIKRGKVKVTKENSQGKEVILAVLSTGDYFGEIALIDGGLRSTNVVALTKTELFLLRRNDVLPLLSNNPKVALHIMRVLAQRLRTASQKIESLALMNVYSRMVKLLTDIAKPMDELLLIEDPFTHQDIANMVGASREMVSRIFRDLVKGGYILTNNKRIIIQKKLPVAW